MKERPRNRKCIYALLCRYETNLEEMYCSMPTFLSHGMRLQLKKMIIEDGNKKNLTLSYRDLDYSLKKSEDWEERFLFGNKKTKKEVDDMVYILFGE